MKPFTFTLTPRRLSAASAALATAVLIAACGGSGGSGDTPPVGPTDGQVTIYDRTTAPAKLSAWHFVLSDGAKLTLNTGVVPYDLNTPLFSDYAFKLRALYVPAGKTIGYKADGTLDFPVGSAIMKTFYYPKATGSDAATPGVARADQTAQGSSIDLKTHRLIETRVMVLQADGTWTGLPYVWDAIGLNGIESYDRRKIYYLQMPKADSKALQLQMMTGQKVPQKWQMSQAHLF